MYFTGPHKPMQPMGYPGVVVKGTRDLNANTGVGVTFGTQREFTVFDDQAVGVKRYAYVGVANLTPVPSLSEMDSPGGVRPGHLYANVSGGYFWGGGAYTPIGHLKEDGVTPETGPTSPGGQACIYYVFPIAISTDICGAVSGHWYGPEFLQ